MSSRFLPVIAENATLTITEAVPLLLARSLDLAAMESLCTSYRQRGLCALFRGSLPAVLHADLQRSGAAFAFFLEGLDDEVKVASRAAPLFDALASGDVATARVIVARARPTWNAGEEYEDDFLYAALVGELLDGASVDGRAHRLIARYDEVLAGAADIRLPLCRSLLASDAEAFEVSLQGLLEAHEERYREGIEEAYIHEEQWATEGQLCVEGLAMLRLAELRAMPTRTGYPFIPSSVVKSVTPSSDPFSWRAESGG